MNGDEGTGHGRVAGEEERAAFFQDAGESVADRVHAKIGPVVANADYDGGGTTLGTAALSEVNPDELDHVGL